MPENSDPAAAIVKTDDDKPNSDELEKSAGRGADGAELPQPDDTAPEVTRGGS